LLDAVSGPPLGDIAACRSAWHAAEEALRSGVLISGRLPLDELLPPFDASKSNGHVQDEHEWQPLHRLADTFPEGGQAALRPLSLLRYDQKDPLLVVLVAAFFKYAVETDADLFGGLQQLLQEDLACRVPPELAQLAVTLDRHRPRLDVLLGE